MIKVENIFKSFGSVVAVDNLSFEIQKGEVVGFLGPNAAGKTTTMRMITGFLYPDQGNIFIDKIRVNENDLEAKKKIGYLPENNPLYKEMLVKEILDFSSDLKQILPENKKQAFDFVVPATGISQVFYRPIKELSKGYKQRVGLACALLGNPDILIMDEPTEGLDPTQREEIRKLIRNLSQDHTIILSTHVMQEVTAVCNRILIINKGKLVADGNKEEIIKKAHTQETLYLDIEGKIEENDLKKIEGIAEVNILEKEKSRLRADIILKEKTEIRPEISKLVKENDWIIWELKEKTHSLEEVFRKLTEE